MAAARGALRGRDRGAAARQVRRSGGDEDAARRSFARAAEIFDRLGAALDSRHTHDLTSPSTLPAGLSEREAEVLTMVASGQTNKDIAGTPT